MEDRSFYNEILTEHNIRPEFKVDIQGADITLEGVNPSCGDDIVLKLKLDGDTIVDGGYTGSGCAISQASADIMLGMVIGKKKEEALDLAFGISGCSEDTACLILNYYTGWKTFEGYFGEFDDE